MQKLIVKKDPKGDYITNGEGPAISQEQYEKMKKEGHEFKELD